MGCGMNTEIKNLIVFESDNKFPIEVMECMYKRIISVAGFFGYTYLPKEIRLHLHICDTDRFEKIKNTTNLVGMENVIAFTCNINHIYVTDYKTVEEQFNLSSYVAVIVHECIHVLQYYFSRISQNEYIWLYESIACYLSGQKETYNNYTDIKWDSFVREFYGVPNCYGRAYKFGEILFNAYPNSILNIIKSPQQYEKQLDRLFNMEIHDNKI